MVPGAGFEPAEPEGPVATTPPSCLYSIRAYWHRELVPLSRYLRIYGAYATLWCPIGDLNSYHYDPKSYASAKLG